MAIIRTAGLKNLEDRLLKLKKKFISPHTSPTASPGTYLLDLQSYAILAHAAFEEYIEFISVKVAEKAFEKFKNEKKMSFTTLCMLHFIEGHDSLNSWANTDIIYDRLLSRLGNIKVKVSQMAASNNGIDMKYLKKLLIPVGLDIPHTAIEINSINQLARYRGTYAHQSTIALSIIPTPSDVVNAVTDVLNYMRALDQKARKVSYYKIYR